MIRPFYPKSASLSSVMDAPELTFNPTIGQVFDADSPIFMPENAEQAAYLAGMPERLIVGFERTDRKATLMGLTYKNGGYVKAEYTFCGLPNNMVVNAEDAEKACIAFLQSLSAASASQVTYRLKYLGRNMDIDDAHEEYELSLDPGTDLQVIWSPRMWTVMDVSDMDIKFRITNKATILQILAASVIDYGPDANRLNLMYRNSVPKAFPKYQLLGTASKKVSDTTIQVVAGAGVYLYDGKHFLDLNLNASLEDLGFSKKVIKELVGCLTPAKPEKAKIPRVAVVPANPNSSTQTPIEDNSVAEVRMPRNGKEPLYGAYFAVSSSQPDRSRIVFGPTMDAVVDEAVTIVRAYRTPVPITIIKTNTRDPIYISGISVKNTLSLKDKPSVIIKASLLLSNKYKDVLKVLNPKMNESNADIDIIEPLPNPPVLTVPGCSQYADKVAEQIRFLIGKGYFSRNLNVDTSVHGDKIVLKYPAPNKKYQAVVKGCARRIFDWLTSQGVGVIRVQIENAVLYSTLKFELPTLSAAAFKAVTALEANPPTLGAPVYRVEGKEHLAVAVTAVNKHKGTVTVAPTRSADLHYKPYDVLYTKLKPYIE